MWEAKVAGPWVGTGAEEDAYRAQVNDDYTLKKCENVGDQPAAQIVPDPNVLVANIWCEIGELNNIDNDPNYQVLESFELPEEPV